MSRTKITKRFLDSLYGGAKDVFIRDTDLTGFGVKVTPKSSISFFAEGRIRKGKTKRITLGKYPLLPLDTARQKAQETLLVMKDGFDPVELEVEERLQRAKIAAIKDAKLVSLQAVFENYKYLRPLKSKTVHDYTNTFNVCLSDWLDEPVPMITRRAVEQRFIKIKDENGKGQATKCMRILNAVLNHAKAFEVDEGVRLITENPCDVLKEKKIDRNIKPRERYLEKEELGLVLEELSHIQHPDYAKQKLRMTNVTVADFITLLLFTGLRREEASTLKWADVNVTDAYFTIHDTKNGTDHVVPMSKPIISMFERRHSNDNKHDIWVFPNRFKSGPLREPRKQMERLTEITGVKFSCHDLRRTFATLAEAYGIDYHTIKRALNHKSQDITARYIQTRVDKMRHVFDSVAKEIMWWAFEDPKLTDEELYKSERKGDEDIMLNDF